MLRKIDRRASVNFVGSDFGAIRRLPLALQEINLSGADRTAAETFGSFFSFFFYFLSNNSFDGDGFCLKPIVTHTHTHTLTELARTMTSPAAIPRDQPRLVHLALEALIIRYCQLPGRLGARPDYYSLARAIGRPLFTIP